jgi:hypothetical protein
MVTWPKHNAAGEGTQQHDKHECIKDYTPNIRSAKHKHNSLHRTVLNHLMMTNDGRTM